VPGRLIERLVLLFEKEVLEETMRVVRRRRLLSRTLVELACSMRGLLSSALFINARNAAETSNRGKQF